MSGPAPKRLAKTPRSKGPIIAAIAAVAAVGLAVGGYFGLCSWAQDNGRLLPGTIVSGMPGSPAIDIGKMDPDEARQLLRSSLNEQLEKRSITIAYGGQTARLEGDLLTTDPDAPVDNALAEKAAQPYYQMGMLWLGMGRNSEHSVSALSVSPEGANEVRRLAGEIAQSLYVPPVDFTYELTEDTVELTRGTDGQGVDEDALVQTLTNALLSGEKVVEILPKTIPSAELTGESLSQLIYTAPQSPTMGADGQLTPTVMGHSIDPKEAQTILDATQPGESCSIPMTTTLPDFGDESLLFQDLLSSSETFMAGTENRRTNIRLAAAAVDGTVVMPGQVFSYNETVGERTAAKGYQTATVYVGGEDKQELGGGICQLASALYNCTLYADLEIVFRTNHRFAVTYVPYGLDATVAWPSVDYKFRNNTSYPIKISAVTQGNDLIVKFYGTKENDNYVEMKTVQLSKTPFNTRYEIDETLGAGETRELVHAYTGYKYESYRYVYDRDKNLLSNDLEASSTYSYRDKVVAVSPYDAAAYGLDAGELPPPAPSEEPDPGTEPTEPVEPTASPEPSAPVSTPPVEPSEPPAEPTPESTPQPEPDAGLQPQPTPSDSGIPDWMAP